MTQENPRVLVVEDGAMASLVEKMILTRFGCEVDTASTGEEAIRLCRTNHYHLILMDIELGHGLDGCAVSRRIRQAHPNADTVIVALTSQPSENLRAQATASGMNDFLRKPLMDDQIQKIFQDYLHLDEQRSRFRP